MKHEDGHCDTCGCELVHTFALTIDGNAVCIPCSTVGVTPTVTAKRPEARDDGR